MYDSYLQTLGSYVGQWYIKIFLYNIIQRVVYWMDFKLQFSIYPRLWNIDSRQHIDSNWFIFKLIHFSVFLLNTALKNILPRNWLPFAMMCFGGNHLFYCQQLTAIDSYITTNRICYIDFKSNPGSLEGKRVKFLVKTCLWFASDAFFRLSKQASISKQAQSEHFDFVLVLCYVETIFDPVWPAENQI